jgi:glycosyltransferase involved in cell wall biosynthesis
MMIDDGIGLSIVIPAFNEAGNLEGLVRSYRDVYDALDKDFELVVVDNGSRDNTQEVLAKLRGADYPFLKIATTPENLGYGGGILFGLKQARGRYLGWSHADMQCEPYDAARAFRALKRHAQPERLLVKGHRYGRPFLERVVSFMHNFLATIILRMRFVQANGQPKVFHRSLFDLLKDPPQDISLDLYLLYVAKKNDFIIETIPVFLLPRHKGVSTWAFGLRSRFKWMARCFIYILKLWKKETMS